MFRRIFTFVKDFLFPEVCYGCQKHVYGNHVVSTLCKMCNSMLPFRSKRTMMQKAVDSNMILQYQYNLSDNINVYSACYYCKLVKKLIVDLKFYDLRCNAICLAEIALLAIIVNDLHPDVIIPIPLHEARLNKRGYNQSELIAREISLKTGIAVLTNCLIRLRNTKRQSETENRYERFSNVDSAFYCKDIHSLKDKNIIILDDVLTSGFTMLNAAQAIKKASIANNINVKNITGLVIASER